MELQQGSSGGALLMAALDHELPAQTGNLG
jgi:hypothetical protein